MRGRLGGDLGVICGRCSAALGSMWGRLHGRLGADEGMVSTRTALVAFGKPFPWGEGCVKLHGHSHVVNDRSFSGLAGCESRADKCSSSPFFFRQRAVGNRTSVAPESKRSCDHSPTLEKWRLLRPDAPAQILLELQPPLLWTTWKAAIWHFGMDRSMDVVGGRCGRAQTRRASASPTSGEGAPRCRPRPSAPRAEAAPPRIARRRRCRMGPPWWTAWRPPPRPR